MIPSNNSSVIPTSIMGGEKYWKIRRIVYEDVLQSLDSIFESLEIKYMPIKGAYLICSGFADRINSRQMLDLDILVEEKRFHEIIDLLDKHPLFTKGKEDPWYFEYPFFYRNGNHSVRIELHYLLNRPERFRLPNEDLFCRSVKQTNVRYLPCPEDALLILICHSMIHLADGLAKTFFDEIEILAEREGFSWEKFNYLLKSSGVAPFGYFMLKLCSREKNRDYTRLVKNYRWVDILWGNCEPLKRTDGINRIKRRFCVELPFAARPGVLLYEWSKRFFK